jgi:ribonuclease PH
MGTLSSASPRSVATRRAQGVAGVSAALIALLLACLPLLAGCVSAGADSDIPWNDPQPWEGSPAIPGLSGNGRY